jgi:hypothetical protein
VYDAESQVLAHMRRGPLQAALTVVCGLALSACALGSSSGQALLESGQQQAQPVVAPAQAPPAVAPANAAGTEQASADGLNRKPAPTETPRQSAGADYAARSSPLTLPPPGYFEPAGPGAQNDIDQETLNGPPIAKADTTLPMPGLLAAAQMPLADAPPEEAAKLDAATQSPDAGTVIRAVAVVPVKGAPGTGNQELTEAMRSTLRKAGWAVLDAPRADALTLAGEVGVAQPDGGKQRVAVHWTVATPEGKTLGDVKQANAVPAGSLDAQWGEAATVVAEAAAPGIFDLVAKFR